MRWLALTIAAMALTGCKEAPKTWPCKELIGVFCYLDSIPK